jgi:hypothetical protein
VSEGDENGPARLVDDDVRRIHRTVGDADVVQIRQGRGDRCAHACDLLCTEVAQIRQRSAVYAPQLDPEAPIRQFPRRQELDDTRVARRLQDACFVREPGPSLGGGTLLQQNVASGHPVQINMKMIEIV